MKLLLSQCSSTIHLSEDGGSPVTTWKGFLCFFGTDETGGHFQLARKGAFKKRQWFMRMDKKRPIFIAEDCLNILFLRCLTEFATAFCLAKVIIEIEPGGLVGRSGCCKRPVWLVVWENNGMIFFYFDFRALFMHLECGRVGLGKIFRKGTCFFRRGNVLGRRSLYYIC